MNKITSVKNDKVKYWYSLRDGKSEEVLLEGSKLIKDAINNGLNIDTIIVESKCTDKYSYLYSNADEVVEVADNVMSKLSYQQTPQGIMALIKLNSAHKIDFKRNFLVLDGIQDPGNLGAIVRSALGAGFIDIVCINCASYRSSKAIRSSMGSVLYTNIHTMTVDKLKEVIPSVPLYCADMDGDNVFDFVPSKPFGLIIGSEGKGVSADLRSMATHTLRIPMDSRLESLNAAVSASVMMYVLTNK